MYFVRPRIQRQTNETLDDKYFTQNLLPNFMHDNPGLTEVLQVPRTVDSLILSVLKGSQNVIEAIVSVKAERSSSVYS